MSYELPDWVHDEAKEFDSFMYRAMRIDLGLRSQPRAAR